MIRKVFEVSRKLYSILTRAQLFYGILLFGVSLFSALLETLGVTIIVPLVNALLNPQIIRESAFADKILESIGAHSDLQIVFVIGGTTIVVYILKNLFFLFSVWIKQKYACKVQRECSLFMMKSYLKRGYSFFLHTNYSEVAQSIQGDVGRLHAVLLGLIQIFTQIMIISFIGLFMLIADWKIALSVLLASLLCVILVFTVFRRVMSNVGQRMRTFGILTQQSFYECFQGIKETIAFRKQAFFLKNYETNLIQGQNAEVVYNLGVESPAYIIEGFCVSAIMIALCVRMVSMKNLASFVPLLASFAVGAFRILPALGKISSSVNTLSANAVCLDKVYNNLLDSRKWNDEFYDIEKPDNPKYTGLNFSHSVKVEKLTFSYGAEFGNVINDLSIQIPKGKSVALVGGSGAGKTTLVDIILGVLQPTSGQILIDGIDIKEIANRWSELISYVPQSIYLYDKTIMENVAFAEDPKDIDEDLVREALKKARLLDFVEKLPEGTKTRVGDRGVRLSGGQRQRLGIARALYRKPEILILDEATSALDNETENSVMEAIDFLQGEITMIIVAHRLTTIRNCDFIYEIKDGRAVLRQYEELI